jgi:hypothetical protein
MPAKKAKTPVKVETPDDIYIVVDRSQQVFYFNTQAFYDFINQRSIPDKNKRTLSFFKEFPLPRPGMNNLDTDRDNDRINLGSDRSHRAYGRYCPFQAGVWQYGELVVLKNGTIFVPEMKEVTRVVKEYGPVTTDATPPVTITKEAPVAIAAKKTVKRRR